jgi:hypothetical protein
MLKQPSDDPIGHGAGFLGGADERRRARLEP